MSKDFEAKKRNCCSMEHERLTAELDTCDQLYQKPSEWHRCARIIARRSGQRAKHCMLRE
jgi:hypothetical protein